MHTVERRPRPTAVGIQTVCAMTIFRDLGGRATIFQCSILVPEKEYKDSEHMEYFWRHNPNPRRTKKNRMKNETFN
jgi:hypothetical protein